MQKVNVTDDLGDVIKSARNEKHLTQKKLSERLNISLRYLKALENSGQKPSYRLLKLIVATLDIPVELVFKKINHNDPVKKHEERKNHAERKKSATNK